MSSPPAIATVETTARGLKMVPSAPSQSALK
jgi:hypothetical protein